MLLPVVVFGVGLLSAATGVESSIDARHLASEPIGRWTLGLGMLAAAAVGPPAVLSVLSGAGIVAGLVRAVASSVLVVLVAVVAWWCTLLLFSRTFANLLGALATGRLQQIAQAAATLSALLGWVLVQVLARDTTGWDAQRWATLGGLGALDPSRAAGPGHRHGGSDPGTAALHLLAGLSWLPAAGVGERGQHRAAGAELAASRRSWQRTRSRERSRAPRAAPRPPAAGLAVGSDRGTHRAHQVPHPTPGGQHGDGARRSAPACSCSDRCWATRWIRGW